MSATVKSLAVGALVAGTMTLTGCGSTSSKQSEKAPSSSPSSSAAAAEYDWELAFAGCMREAGIDYPDPKPGQDGPVKIPAGDVEAYERANDTCEESITEDRGVRPVSAERRKLREHWNEVYAVTVDCLRKKGHEVEVVDGGFEPTDEIPEADFSACQALQSEQGQELGS